MNHKKTFTIALWWCIGFAVVGGLLILHAPRDTRVSESENRMLQGLPELSIENLLSGDFSGEFENFLSDGFFFREEIISFSENIVGLLSRNTAEDEYFLDNTEDLVADIGMDSEEAQTDAAADSQQEEDISGNESDHSEVRLWLNRTDGGTHTIYKYPMENIITVAETLEMYNKLLPEDGNIFYTTVPFPNIARWWYGSYEFTGWENNLPETIDELTSENIHSFDTPAILQDHIAAGECLYFFDDHHWNTRGAYYVCAEMLASQGYPVTPYEEYEYDVNYAKLKEAGGYDVFEFLYALAPVKNTVIDHVDNETEIPFMRYGSKLYSAYLSNTRTPWRRIDTGFNTGRKALVIGDSFNLAFTPFLIPYYDEVHMTDLRVTYYDKSELGMSIAEMIELTEIDDIYFIYSEANGVNSENQLIYLRKYLYE